MAPVSHRASGWTLSSEVTGITLDSRLVKPGYIFVAVPGFSQDGHRFILDAIHQGAIAVVGEKDVTGLSVPYFKVASSRQAAAELAATFYRFPSSDVKTIGVTGTNGKTTVVFWLTYLLRKTGRRVGMVSSVINETGPRALPATLTTPESPELQEYLAEMRENGMTHAVIEVSSHGIAQQRVAQIDFSLAILTNITREHLDFHGTMERYVQTKARLFQGLGPHTLGAVLNADDPHTSQVRQAVQAPVVTYGIEAGDVRGTINTEGAWWSDIAIGYPGCSFTARLNHPGRYNVYNLLAVVAAGALLGVSSEEFATHIPSLPQVPGRMQVFGRETGPLVVVDYAHTPDGLQQLLSTVRHFGRRGIWLIFGARGGRDRGKRPEMGRIAAAMADHIVLTTDSPYEENPEDIAEAIAEGVRSVDESKIRAVELDRAAAIRYAIMTADQADVIVITGRGPETTQFFGHAPVRLVDAEVVEKVLRDRLTQEGNHVPKLH